MWQDPVSAAYKPANVKDIDVSIIVMANDMGIFVNDRKLGKSTPEVLKQTLLDLAKILYVKKHYQHLPNVCL